MAVWKGFAVLLSGCAWGQSLLDDAYAALRKKDLEQAAALFSKGLDETPAHRIARKDYAYTLLKLGETEAARDQFGLTMRSDPADSISALEYAFLCHETRDRAEARRVFDRLRKEADGDARLTAERAFESIDSALTTSIRQWQDAAQKRPEADTVHEELARLAEERDDFALAEIHYAEAFRLKPAKRHFLLDLGRVREQLGKRPDALAAYLAASRSDDVRTAERAREHLPPSETLSDEIQVSAAKYAPMRTSLSKQGDISAIEMADRSFQLSYLNDALRYYESAHEADPKNAHVLLRLGLTQNLLGQNDEAYRWLDRARKSGDPDVAAEARRAWLNLRSEFVRYRVTAWVLPMYSSRWQSAFAYGQFKVELNTKQVFRPYLSLRFATDTGSGRAPGPLSERAVSPAIGVISRAWNGVVGWAEIGGNIGNTQGTDRRTGLAHAKGWGHQLNAETPGWYYLMENSANYASRFANNVMIATQNRVGYTPGRWQAGLFFSVSTDTRREYWANYYEIGPNFRTRLPRLPQNLFLNVELVRGQNYVQRGNPRKANYVDARIGLWYALTY